MTVQFEKFQNITITDHKSQNVQASSHDFLFIILYNIISSLHVP